MNGFELSYNGQKKVIQFDHNGKTNYKQKKYFETLFDNNLKYRGLYDEYSYFGAFRCAKSFSQQLAVFLLCLSNPGLRVCFIRDSYDQLEATVIKQFLEEFQYLGAFTYLPSGTPKRCATFKNGATVLFRSFEKDTDILSAEYDVIAACQIEDLPFELFLQLIGRNSGQRLGTKKGILLSEGNPASGWVKDRYKDQTADELRQKKIFFLEGETKDNPWITQEYIQSLIDNYPKWWLDRYLYGLWDNREELVYSEFNENTMVIDPIDPKTISDSFKRYNGMDWGWVNPTAIGYSFIDYDGNLTIYDEFYQPAKGMTFKEISDNGNRYGRILTVADHAMKGMKLPSENENKHEDRTVWSELEKAGMLLMPCNKEELSNIILVNNLMKRGKFKITRNCVNGIREYRNWKWKRLKLGADKNLPEEPTDLNNHFCDLTNYLAGYLFSKKAPDPAKEKFRQSLQYYVQQKNSEQERRVS